MPLNTSISSGLNLLKKLSQTRWFEILMLTLISGAAYLPYVGRFTYYRDDWYFLYDALVIGPRALIEIALHTRPIRGPLYALYFLIFGLDPTPYHVMMYFTRLLGGLGALWLFSLLWPRQRQTHFFLAVLFVLFPGFLWWVAGFEFQPYVLSVSLQVFSIAFTLKAISSKAASRRIAWTASALLSGWAYLALVEYAIGMEAFRLLCVYLYVRRKNPEYRFGSALQQTLKLAHLHLLVPIVFLIWYQFLFDNWRSAQDAGTQLSNLFSSPVNLLWLLVNSIRSTLNVALFAWAVPFNQNFYDNRLRDILMGLAYAAVAVMLVYLAHRALKNETEPDEDPVTLAHVDLLWVGLLGTFAGILPVILANRVVVFDRISQYSLPASLAGVIFLGGLVVSLFPKTLQRMVLAGLVGLAVLAQHGLAAQAAREEKLITDFWWQVVWRAPQIRPGTTLVVIYPGINYAEGNDVVWGPANFIYSPEKQERMPVHVPIAASRLEADSILEILNANREFEQTDIVIKNTYMVLDYESQLILSQPAAGSCVRALDPRWPDLSIHDPSFIHASARNSEVESIVVDGTAPTPLEAVFGPEPARDWCYYYQKADLARQRGDWDEIVSLAEEAEKLGLHPNDQVELMPFLQAYAFLGDPKQVKGISTRINTERFYKQQACRNLSAMAEFGYPLSPEMARHVNELFC